MMPLLNPANAQLTMDSDGGITLDDPDSPLLVTVRLDANHRLSHLSITARHPTGRITSAGLSRLPLAQMQRLAVAVQTIAPDTAWWTATASLKPLGSRSWGNDHWDHVLAVAEWATNRPGGPAKAIADLWGVSIRPTAYRWLATARRHATSSQHPDHADTHAHNQSADCVST